MATNYEIFGDILRFHVISLPWTQTTSEYSHCAYTQKVRRFCDMMMRLGHEVLLYASEDNDASCTELITCISKLQQKDQIGVEGPADNLKAEFAPNLHYWRLMNGNAIKAIQKRAKKQDFICLIAGLCQREIADAFPELMSVEFGIGYGGTFAKYQVFESYAWMHTVYGAQARDAHAADGRYFDAVIPNYYDVADFPFSAKKDDYYLYVGRLIDRKGWRIAQEVCEKLGKKLVVAGQGEFSGYGEYLGPVDVKLRGKLMEHAQAVFVPSQYLEPFGGVHAEAMLCGTPVITTDWGVFTETVINGFNGFRCRNFQEFSQAAKQVRELDYEAIRKYAISRFSMEAVGRQYQNYFKRLLTLYSDGWYSSTV